MYPQRGTQRDWSWPADARAQTTADASQGGETNTESEDDGFDAVTEAPNARTGVPVMFHGTERAGCREDGGGCVVRVCSGRRETEALREVYSL